MVWFILVGWAGVVANFFVVVFIVSLWLDCSVLGWWLPRIWFALDACVGFVFRLTRGYGGCGFGCLWVVCSWLVFWHCSLCFGFSVI